MANDLIIYLAGIFDGEGYVGAHTLSSKPEGKYADIRISIGFKNGSDGGVLNEAQAVYKGNVRITKQGVIYWDLKGRASEMFLRDIYPYLRIKKRQVELAFEIRATKIYRGNQKLPKEVYDKRLDLGNKIKALNNRTGFGMEVLN